jgi:hypothetical protein
MYCQQKPLYDGIRAITGYTPPSRRSMTDFETWRFELHGRLLASCWPLALVEHESKISNLVLSAYTSAAWFEHIHVSHVKVEKYFSCARPCRYI